VLLVLYVTMLGMAVGVRDAGHIGLESLLCWRRRCGCKMELLIHAAGAGCSALLMAWNCGVLAAACGDYAFPRSAVSEALQVRPAGAARACWSRCFSMEHRRAGARHGSGADMALTILCVELRRSCCWACPVAFSIGLSSLATHPATRAAAGGAASSR
jgi:hypothetical protein